MSPIYDGINYDNTPTTEVLFEVDEFQVAKYMGLDKIQLVHRCDPRLAGAELVTRDPGTGEWKCLRCYRVCPDEVITVWTMMGDAKGPKKYYHTVSFSGLAHAEALKAHGGGK